MSHCYSLSLFLIFVLAFVNNHHDGALYFPCFSGLDHDGLDGTCKGTTINDRGGGSEIFAPHVPCTMIMVHPLAIVKNPYQMILR